MEDVLPRWILRVPGARRWWLSLKSAPIRNWFLQQLVKLSIPNHVSQELLVFADSDVTLIRPFDPAAYLRDGKTRLLSVPGANDTNHTRWHQTAGKLLGLEPKDYYGASYIGNLVPWRRDNVLRLHQHIESVSGKPWLETICRHWHLSEYILYGVFAEQVLRETSGHYPDSTLNCLGHWDQDPLSESQVRDFLSGIKDHHVAIMISSKAQFPPNRLAKCIQELELAPSTTPARPSVAPSVR